MNIAKISIGIMFITFSFGFQSVDENLVEFTDKYGNEFKISGSESVFKNLNYEFLEENINGTYFVKNMAESEYDYILSITIHKINRNNYRLRLMIIPKTQNVREIMKYQGFSNYKLKIMRKRKAIELESIEFMYGEI